MSLSVYTQVLSRFNQCFKSSSCHMHAFIGPLHPSEIYAVDPMCEWIGLSQKCQLLSIKIVSLLSVWDSVSTIDTMFRLSMTQPHQCAYMDLSNAQRYLLKNGLTWIHCLLVSIRQFSQFCQSNDLSVDSRICCFDCSYLWWDCMAIALAWKQTRINFAMLCLFQIQYVIY